MGGETARTKSARCGRQFWCLSGGHRFGLTLRPAVEIRGRRGRCVRAQERGLVAMVESGQRTEGGGEEGGRGPRTEDRGQTAEDGFTGRSRPCGWTWPAGDGQEGRIPSLSRLPMMRPGGCSPCSKRWNRRGTIARLRHPDSQEFGWPRPAGKRGAGRCPEKRFRYR